MSVDDSGGECLPPVPAEQWADRWFPRFIVLSALVVLFLGIYRL